ncbi:hypothetical protein P3342_000068 [Pyrenophora teres f. teres]|nr:hypothetical protein P3342_000068 [Pyrenophora teres f. teres]
MGYTPGYIPLPTHLQRRRRRLTFRENSYFALCLLSCVFRSSNMGVAVHPSCYPGQFYPQIRVRYFAARPSCVVETVSHRYHRSSDICLRSDIRSHRRQAKRQMGQGEKKKHSEEFLTHGLWSKSRHPNYFGEATLWSGIAIAAAGLLVRQPAQTALGLSGNLSGQMLVAGMCAASPAFVSFLLLKVSGVPLSENKYDKKYGDREDYQKWKRETPMFVPKIF